MKKLLVTALLTATVAGGTAQVKNQSHGYPNLLIAFLDILCYLRQFAFPSTPYLSLR